ncbi:DUF4222 domain-containing protein [Escherichia coli]|uniref:DUF4222 domain-containing protein n=1 Tax=Escherichia coli TaxID=562 RepID=UPI000BE18EB1|nr:DUF4222 domain-containing protein [Escherichia coli]
MVTFWGNYEGISQYGVPVRVIRWEPETQRVIYLREGYEHECFSPLEQFRRKFREIEVGHEH